MKIKPLIILMMVAIPAIFSSTIAVANDAKTFSALSCVKKGTSGILDFENSSIKNTGTTTLVVDCPIVRDSTFVSIASGEVLVTDLSSSSGITCQLKSISQNAATGVVKIESQTKWTSTPVFGNTVVTLFFTALQTTPQAYYYYTCSIPAATASGASKLHGYRISELD